MNSNNNRINNNKRSLQNRLLDELNNLSDSSSSDSDNEIELLLLNKRRKLNSGLNSDYKLDFLTALNSPNEAEGLCVELLELIGIQENSVAWNKLQNGPLFYRLTDLQPSEFIELVRLLEPSYKNSSLQPNNSNNSNNNRVINYPHSNRDRKLDCANALLLYLCGLDGNSFAVLAGWFNFSSVSSVFYYIELMGNIIINALDGELEWPNAERRKLLYGYWKTYDKIIGIIDGTQCKIKRPNDLEEAGYYCKRKEMHAMNYLFVVDPNGFVIYVDGPYAGRRVDQEVAVNSELIQQEERYFSPGERILADGGFPGISRFIIPYRKDQIEADIETKESKREFNNILTLTRSKVEHLLHRIKSRAQSLANRFNRNKGSQQRAVKAAVLIYNWTRRLRIKKQL
jgi:hypothetical protein